MVLELDLAFCGQPTCYTLCGAIPYVMHEAIDLLHPGASSSINKTRPPTFQILPFSPWLILNSRQLPLFRQKPNVVNRYRGQRSKDFIAWASLLQLTSKKEERFNSMEGEDALGMSGGAGLSDSLQKEINRREAFERKNAELEGVNDQLRVENGVSFIVV